MPWSHMYWKYANKGDLPAIREMFSRGKASPLDVNLRGFNGLLYSIYHKDYQISKYLIEQGVDADLPNETGLVGSEALIDVSLAGLYGEEGPGIVKSMLKNDEVTETRAFTKLHKIILKIIPGDLQAELEISTASIDTGDARQRSPLIWAVLRDDIRAVDTLLSFGAKLNTVDDMGNTPLHFVSSASVGRILLKAGADISSRNTDYNRTALHQVCRSHGSVEVIHLLVEAGIPVDVRDADDETPLLGAVFWHLTEAAEKLIEFGADVNAANTSSRNNAIYFAVNYSHHEIIPFLLSYGADYKALNVRGKSIAHVAANSADTKTVQTLAESSLTGLDLSLKDIEGRTSTNYLAERQLFSDSEIGLHEAFAEFETSISFPR
ncbi:MAG: hypothetical protein Q9220_007247 [cf. Caloplaca sp. 1 TL-2023]